MKKTYCNPKVETIDLVLDQHILLTSTSTKDTIIDNKNEVDAEASLTKGYEGRKNGIWD
jgi:hypothetical protein